METGNLPLSIIIPTIGIVIGVFYLLGKFIIFALRKYAKMNISKVTETAWLGLFVIFLFYTISSVVISLI